MSPTAALVVHTGVTLAESLRWTDLAERALDEAGLEEPESWTPSLVAHSERIDMMWRVADSRFNSVALTLEDARVIEQILNDVPFFGAQAAFGAGQFYFATRRFREGFKRKVDAEYLETRRASEGHVADLDLKTYAAVVEEGILHAVVTPDEEVRRCAMCSRWFAGKYRARNRFCSTDCRRRFAAISSADGKNKFDCALGDHEAPVAAFAGLRVRSEDDDPRILTIAGYRPRGTTQVCTGCVRAKHPGWASYIAPVLGALERAGAAL